MDILIIVFLFWIIPSAICIIALKFSKEEVYASDVFYSLLPIFNIVYMAIFTIGSFVDNYMSIFLRWLNKGKYD